MKSVGLLLAMWFATTCLRPSVTQEKTPPGSAGAPAQASVPLALDDNRVFIELRLRRPDGTMRRARAWVDTGGGWFAITEGLANELKAERKGKPFNADGGQQAIAIAAPPVFLGDMPLELDGALTAAILGAKKIDPGIDAEVFLPARVLKQYCVVFDYPARTFTIAQPGVLKPRGLRVASPIQPETGFPRIELTVEGASYGFLLDTGAAYTMISRELLEKWATSHPGYARLTGAVGPSNMIGNAMEVNATVLRIPVMEWGGLRIQGAGAVSREVGVFETMMSKLMSSPIVGALGGNALRTMRVEIDYSNRVTYLEQAAQPDANDLDTVGIILKAEEDGYRIAGVARRDEKPVVSVVQAGDRLLRVDTLKVTGATRDAVLRALQGKPGEKRQLLLERDGKEIEVEAVVHHLL
jgi:predicted aspartyl protease